MTCPGIRCQPGQNDQFTYQFTNGGSTMTDTNVTLVLPAGGTRTAEVPDDVPVKELIPELTHFAGAPHHRPGWSPDQLPAGQQSPGTRAAGRRNPDSRRCAGGRPPADHCRHHRRVTERPGGRSCQTAAWPLTKHKHGDSTTNDRPFHPYPALRTTPAAPRAYPLWACLALALDVRSR